MFKKRETTRTLPNQQKTAYLSVMFLAILSLILLLRIALIGLSNDGLVFHWIIVGLAILIGLFVQNYVAPVSRLSSFGWRAVGLLFFAIALAIKSWSVSTNPFFILSIFFMTVKEDYLTRW
ncbi:MAG: hypothetical protein GX956_09095 [Firmicutes bacterium]|nr:hypothetical protein [Bacillota bacterium]